MAWLSGLWVIALGASSGYADDGAEGERSVPRAEAECDDGDGNRGEACEAEPREPPGRFELGIGISPDEGFVFGAGVSNDRLFGTDHGLSLSALLSSRRQDFDLRYDARTLFGSELDLRTELWNHRREYVGFTREGVGGGLTLSRPIARNTRGYLGFRYEQVGVDIEADASRGLLHARGTDYGLFDGGNVAALRTGLIYDSRTRRFDPRAGTRFELFAERADRRLGSDFDLARAGARLEHHAPVGFLTLHLYGGAEGVWGLHGQVVPLAERLQLEGHADVRGFGYGTAGPMLTTAMGGTTGVGGNLEATGRAELEIPLVPRLGLSTALFYDAGYIRDFDGLAAPGSGLYQSAGIAIIWRSPIGPLRFDWAFPLDRDGKRDGGPEFLFSLGNSF